MSTDHATIIAREAAVRAMLENWLQRARDQVEAAAHEHIAALLDAAEQAGVRFTFTVDPEIPADLLMARYGPCQWCGAPRTYRMIRKPTKTRILLVCSDTTNCGKEAP